jgi:hypothetical protein
MGSLAAAGAEAGVAWWGVEKRLPRAVVLPAPAGYGADGP